MTSSYHSQYPLLHIDLNQDHQDHQDVFLFSTPKPAYDQVTYSSSSSSSSSSALLYPSFLNANQDGAGYTNQRWNPVPENESNTNVGAIVGSCELLNREVPKLGRIKLSITKKKEGANKIASQATGEGTNGNSAKSTSSKIRLMKKMVKSLDQPIADHQRPDISMKDHEQASSFRPDINNNTSDTVAVRVCSDCNTTKTPLWRSGPRGPKSLCNACGIRQRKARRAAAAAAAAANGTALETGSTPPPPPPALKTNKVQKKEKKASDSHLPFKKRCTNLKSRGRGRKKIGFEDLPMILSKNSTFHQVFPQDEKDAAILLMALSYGLVHG